MAILVCKVGTIRIGDFELDPLKRFLVGTRQFVYDQIALGLIAELQGDRLAGLDLGRLGRVVEQESFFSAGFLDDQRCAGLDAFNQDGARRVGGKVAIAITHHGAVALGHKELNIRDWRVICTGHLLNEKRTHGAVAKIHLYDLLFLPGEVDRLGRGVDDVRAVAGEFFDDVGAWFAISHREGAID